MNVEQLQEKRAKLGEAKLAQLREECLRRSTGHLWMATATNVPQTYCGHCFSEPKFDNARATDRANDIC